MSRTLTAGQRVILEHLLKSGTGYRGDFHEEDLAPLIEWNYLREVTPKRIGITPLGTEAVLPPSQSDANRIGDKRATYKKKDADFAPLTEGQRGLLLLIAREGGSLDASAYDGRTARALQERGLAARSEDGMLTITPAGEKRVPARSAQPTPQAVRPAARPAPAAVPAEKIQTTPEPEVRRALSVEVIVEGMDEAHFKALVLDMLMASSPSVKDFYEAVRAAEDAAGRLKGV